MRLKPVILSLLFGLWLYGLIGFYKTTQNFPAVTSSVDGIVILTGGKDRIQTGMGLFSSLGAKRILISGVDKAVNLSIIKSKQLKGYDHIHQFTDIGYGAVNTLSNAMEAAVWVRNRKFKSIALVTSRFHIPRSLLLFEKALPEVQILTIVVDKDDTNFVHLLKEYHKYYLTMLVSKFLFDGDSDLKFL